MTRPCNPFIRRSSILPRVPRGEPCPPRNETAPIWRVAVRAKHRRGPRSRPSPLQVTTPGPGSATQSPRHARIKKAPGKTVSQGGGGHASFPGAIGRSVPSWPTQGQPDGSTECFRSAPHASMPTDKRFAVRRNRAIARSPDADPSTWIVASSTGDHTQIAACRLAPPKGTITFAAGNPGRCCRGLVPAASGMPYPASVCHPHDVREIIRFAQRRQGRFL